MEPAPIPVSIIGGYLGAGKTTLLNALLRNAEGMRWALLVNDFGSVNVDAGLIASAGQETIELTNGCTCCTIGGDLILALQRIAAREVRPDRIVIEASGVANPAAVARLAAAHPGLAVQGTIVVADAETIRARAGDRYVGGIVRRQLDAADAIVLSKMDLIDAGTQAAVRGWLAQTCPGAAVFESVAGADVPAHALFAARSRGAVSDDAVSDGAALRDDAHSAAFRSATYRSARPLDRGLFLDAARAMVPALARAKGTVCFADAPQQTQTFQLAGERWSIVPLESTDRAPATTIVLIAIAERAPDLAVALDALRAAETR